MNEVQRKAFSGPFCLGVTRKTGEAKEEQRDANETAKKSDGAKTRSWAGATPLFGPSVSKVTGGVAPAHPSVLAASPFLPWPHASAHFSIGLPTPAAKADPNDPPNVPSWLFFTSPAVLGVGFRFGVASNNPICPSTSWLSKITLRCGARS